MTGQLAIPFNTRVRLEFDRLRPRDPMPVVYLSWFAFVVFVLLKLTGQLP